MASGASARARPAELDRLLVEAFQIHGGTTFSSPRHPQAAGIFADLCAMGSYRPFSALPDRCASDFRRRQAWRRLEAVLRRASPAKTDLRRGAKGFGTRVLWGKAGLKSPGDRMARSFCYAAIGLAMALACLTPRPVEPAAGALAGRADRMTNYGDGWSGSMSLMGRPGGAFASRADRSDAGRPGPYRANRGGRLPPRTLCGLQSFAAERQLSEFAVGRRRQGRPAGDLSWRRCLPGRCFADVGIR